MFGAIAAVGAGLRVSAAAVEAKNLSVLHIALALVIPVGAVIVMIFVTWSVLMRSYDVAHLPLLVISLIPLAAAVIVGLFAHSFGIAALVAVIALVALSSIVEVVGHEAVGYRHTIDVVDHESR